MFDLFLAVLAMLPCLLGCVVDLSQPRINLKQLARREGVHFSTAWRWALRGVCGVKLPTRCIGSKRVTTAEAFSWWSEQITAIRNGEAPSRPTSPRHERKIAAAEKELAKRGM